MRRKYLATVIILVLVAFTFMACGTTDNTNTAAQDNGTTATDNEDTDSQNDSAATSAGKYTVKYDDSTWGPDNPTMAEPKIEAVQIGPLSKTPISTLFGDILPLDDGPIGDPEKNYKIGLSVPKSNNVWFMGLQDTMQIEANKHPNVELVILNANGDAAKQATDIEALTAQDVDAIIVDPIQEDALVPAMKAAIEKGFLVFGCDRQFSDEEAFISEVTCNPNKAPEDLANWCIDYLKEKNGGEVRGKIAEIQVDMGSTPQIVRHEQFIKIISGYPDVEVVGGQAGDGDEQKAYNIMNDIASANPDIDIVYAQSENMARGAYSALDSIGQAKGKAFIGVDVSKDAAAWVADGKLQAVAPFTPNFGDVALRLAVYAINGDPIPRQVWLPNQPLMTKDNVKSEAATGYGPVPEGYEDMWKVGEIPG